MPSEPVAPPPVGVGQKPVGRAPATADLRAGRPYLFKSVLLRSLVRRVAAIAVLAGLDAVGLALGLYAALVLRSIVFGDPIFWNLLWEAGPAEWLPFLVPITWLVFWQAGLYAGRERRAGAGRIASSIVLVAAITLAFGWGTDYDFTTSGLIPTACVTSALAIGLPAGRVRVADARAAAAAARAPPRTARRRGRAARVARARADLAAAASRTTSSGRSRPDATARSRRGSTQARPDEIVLSEGGVDEETVLELVETAHRSGVRVRIAPKTTELLLQRGEYVPGQGVPLFELQPPVLAGADWALKKAFDLGVSFLVVSSGCRCGC